MSKQQLMQRLLLSRARVNKMMLKEGVTSDRDFPAITKAAGDVAASKLIINDKSGITIGYLRTALRRMMRKQPLACAFIDYIQLLNGSKQYKGDNRQAEVAEVSKGVKELAKELGIPIVVLAQLTRAVDARGGNAKGRPKLSDLRESGSIEQDADLVGLLTREEYYADNDEERKDAEGKATLIIAKQRNGPTGDVPLTFLKEFARFENRARDIEEYQEPELPKNRQPVRWT
jgi:replicative DNA helicase